MESKVETNNNEPQSEEIKKINTQIEQEHEKTKDLLKELSTLKVELDRSQRVQKHQIATMDNLKKDKTALRAQIDPID